MGVGVGVGVSVGVSVGVLGQATQNNKKGKRVLMPLRLLERYARNINSTISATAIEHFVQVALVGLAGVGLV